MGYLTAGDFGLTEKQLTLVTTLVATGSQEQAVKAAGYVGKASIVAAQALASPAVAAALRHEINRKLLRDAAAAQCVLVEIMNDRTAPKGVRVDAAKAVLDRAGFIAPRQGAGSGETKPLNEMSSDDLRRFISESERELSGRAKDVNAPEALTRKAQVSDMLD
jgi:phage terminase small subunit